MNIKNKNEIFNYAISFAKSNKIDFAIEIFKKIYKYYPEDYKSLYHIARLYLDKKDYANSIKYYHYLSRVDPKNIQAKFDLSHIYLLNRDLIKGFKIYENRIKFKEYNHILPNNYPKKIKEIKNKKVFIYWEQGFGDTINFIRYVKYLEKYTNDINVYIQKPLITLMKHNFRSMSFVEDNSYLNIKYDYVFSLLSIPYLLKIKSFKPIKKYLNINRKYKNINKESKMIKIGLCWQGEYKNKRDKQRSFNIDDFLTKVYSSGIKNLENIRFYSLQKDIVVKSDNVIDLGKSFHDFYDTSIAIKTMDLIITVDTAVCHLSGALGVKTFLLLPFYPDWRWGDTLEKSDLYKSIKYFRQVKKDSWEEPFELVISKLKKLKSK